MNHSRLTILLALLLSLNIVAVAGAQPPVPAAPLGTAFIYQGRLRSGSAAVTRSCDFRFSLWDALDGGLQVGNELLKDNVTVSDGRFTVELDFGAAAFDGNGRWLLVAVRCPTGSGNFTKLTPRQVLAPSPYALRATTAGSAGMAGSVPWAGVTGKPDGFADNIDNDTQYSAGNGLTLAGTQFSVAVPLNLSGASANPILSATNTGTGRAGFFTNAGTLAALRGQSSGNNSTGVYGEADNGPGAYGVWGYTTSGLGTVGESQATNGIGVLGLAPIGARAFAVFGINANGNSYWIPGASSGVAGASGNNIGVAGTSDTNVGVYGFTNNASSYAGLFDGALRVNNANFTVVNGMKNFLIDHPLDPANKYLRHAAVESSDMKNIYDGVVTLDASGAATVTLPDWFEALNQDFRYQLTPIAAPGPNLYIAQEIQGNHFAIGGGTPGMKVSWQVTGNRHDAWAAQHPMQVEEVKPPEARGKYLYPQGYGQPASKGENYTKQQQVTRSQSRPENQSKTP